MAEGEDVVLLSEEQEEWEDEVKKLLEVIEKRPAGSRNASSAPEPKEGYLLKKKRKSNKWQKYFFVISPSTGRLTYYSSRENLRMQGMVDVCFVSHREMHEQDALALEQHNEGKEVCKYRVSVFATGRHFVLSAESDADMESWIEAFDRLLAYKYSAEELKAKAKAAKRLAPVIDDQEECQMERYKYLRSVLAQTGFLSDDGPTKVKEGYLKLKLDDADSTWKKYYFVLHKRYLNYYRLEEKRIPCGIIALRFMISVEPVAGKKGNRKFLISTPFRSYLLRGKHEVAAIEWVNALRTAKGQREKKKGSVELLSLDSSSTSSAPSFSGRLVLQYTLNGRTKSYVSSGRSVTIGRASTNDIKFPDTKISRNHCKILLEDGKAVFYDLGSSRGSKVNNERVTTQALQVGDTIKIGATVLTVDSR